MPLIGETQMQKADRSKVAEFIRTNPMLSYPEIANLLQLGYSTLTRIAAEFGVRRARGPKSQINLPAVPSEQEQK
jgi:hypothetical protein